MYFQVEYNCIAASLAALTEEVYFYHRTLLNKLNVETSQFNHKVNNVRGKLNASQPTRLRIIDSSTIFFECFRKVRRTAKLLRDVPSFLLLNMSRRRYKLFNK